VDLTEGDVILITYGDQIQCPPEAPLRTLNAFCRKYLKEVVSGIHILPFYPWTSDDGFSVLDYRKVDPALGDWSDILAIREDFS
jgi:sucrose phosphorylase